MEMDRSYKMSILVFLMISTNCVSGLDIPQPDNLLVNMLDGEVIAFWDLPKDAPSNVQYNVQMAKYGLDWANVTSCKRISVTYCDLTNHIRDYSFVYKVRVQLVTGEGTSEWTIIKKFYPNKSELQPPSFTLLATSSTLTVKVHKKPILKKIFPFGMIYTIYLEKRGEDNETITVYLKDQLEEDEEQQGTKMFDSLRWGREYCVSLRVQGSGAVVPSNISPEQCLLLPEQEWYIIAVSSLSILVVMAVLAVLLTVLCCFLRRPEKTPVSLKSPASGWSPLSVREGPMEVVTDKGWFLYLSKPEVKRWIAEDTMTKQAMVNMEERQEERTSMDSGVSMESNSVANNGGSDVVRQDDSGFESVAGSESSASCRSNAEEHPLQEGRANTDVARKREDSGVGLGCPLACSGSLDGQNSGLLPETVSIAGDNYRSQSCSAVQLNPCGGEETYKQMLIDPDTVLANVVTGYRAGHPSCVCSGTSDCVWCQTKRHYGPEGNRQYRTACVPNGLLNSRDVDTYEGEHTFSSYHRKTHIQMETVVSIDDSENLPNLPHMEFGEDFPLLTALSSLPLVDGGLNCSMNAMSLSLSDVELKTD
ncbi:interleukin-10 receptor subunit alpha [Polymixia lowei]